MADIKPLSETVVSNVRSGFIISSLAVVVEELTYNSLDAGAKKVLVLIGVNNGYVKVEDDGSGISRDGLMLLGERYATSKDHHLHEVENSAGTFGFRGEALCSIADISLTEIVTKIQGSPNGYRKVMKGRKCLYLSIDDKQDVGTTVVVRDLFYNQPVRRRQLQSSTKKVLHSVRECVMRIALVQPKVAFRVVDMESEDELLCTHASFSPRSLLCSKFGIDSSSLCELGSSEGLLKLTGYVSAPSSLLSAKAIQYIYVNSRFVVKGPIHKALTCLADMCWDRFRGDNDGKRTQPYAGPSYCLNLACPRTSYDLNLEVSGTSVEFKDWAPVIKFIEKSVAVFWSKKKRKGESSSYETDEMHNDGMEKVAEDLSLSKKDWRLNTCKMATKRRRTQNTDKDEAFNEDSLYCTNMLVESGNCGQSRISLAETLQSEGLETERQSEYSLSLCGNRVGDNMCEPYKDTFLSEKNLLESDSGFLKRDDNSEEAHLSYSGWKDRIRGDDLGARRSVVESGFNFECGQDNDRIEDNFRYNQLLSRSLPWDHIPNTPFSCGKKSIQTDDFEATSWRPVGRGDVDSFGKDLDVFQMAHRQRDGTNTWMLPKLSIESHVWKDFDMHSLPSCGGSSDRQPEHLSEKASDFSSCFPAKFDQHSPSVIVNGWDLDRLVEDDGVRRTSELRSCFGFDLSDDEKEEFCHDAFGDTCMDEILYPVSSLNRNLLLGSVYAGVGLEILDSPADGHSVEDISSITYGNLLTPEPNLPLSDVRATNSSVCWSPSESINRGVQLDLQRCQTLGCHENSTERSLRDHHCPDRLLFPSTDDILNAETLSSSLDLRSKPNMFEASGHCVLSTFASKYPGINFPSCQPLETNHSSSKKFEKSSVRTRRSHSAPPVYLGKKRFLSVGDCLTSATENPVQQTDPQVRDLPEKGSVEHSCGAPSIYNEYRQDDKTSSAEDPHICIKCQLKGDPIVSQSTTLSQDVNAEAACDSDHMKEAEELESSRAKWREGCHDTAMERITNCRSVGHRLDECKDENEILNILSSMLHLAGDSLVPKSINRNCLESAKVLSQVDSKFIPVVARGILAVIDQHAADERIRLEEIRQKILSGELKSITYLDEEKELILPEIGYQLLCNYAEPIQHWGWICNIFCQEAGSFAKNLNLLNEQASQLRLLAVPCILGVKLSDTDLLEYLEQLADTDGSSTIPPSVARVLNYKACRGAIMFGDKLLPSECSLIVEELKRTSLCFQCAHGRPTTVPLVNLRALHKGVVQLGASHDSSKTWHGLCRNNISLARAKHRLDAARGC